MDAENRINKNEHDEAALIIQLIFIIEFLILVFIVGVQKNTQ